MKKYFKHKLENLINVSKIVTIHYFEFDKNFKTQGETHDFWELVYTEKESLLCYADGNEILLEPGEILFHKPNEMHSFSANGKHAPNVFVLCFVCKSDAIRYLENKKIRLDASLARFVYHILEEGRKTFDIAYSDPNLKKMKLLQKPTLGDPDRPIARGDVAKTCALMYGASILTLVLTEAIGLGVCALGGFLP